MEETWRWFGDDDPIPLEHVAQAGATGVVTALHQVPAGVAWTEAAIDARKRRIAAAGLCWSVCESIPVPDAIKREGASAKAAMAAWKDSLARLGRAGIPTVCYNFMPVVDWTRTDLMHRMPSGGFALRFDMVDFVAYDAFILARPGAEADYRPDLVGRAGDRLAAMTAGDRDRLERNVIAGLPGGAAAQTRASIAELIESYRGIDAATMRANLAAFLAEVVPVAEEAGVRLGIHPDDPPFPLFGLPRIVSTAADARAVLAAVQSPANGLTFCTGSYGARPDNDLPAMAREFASRTNFAHLRNVTLEPDGCFHEAEHLGGSTDMVAVIAALRGEERRSGRTFPMRPDHGHLLATDVGRPSHPGYSYIGRLKGLAELRGVITALDHAAGAAT